MPANYVLLAEQTVSATVATITLSNIPQTGYTDLKLVASARGTAGSLPDVMLRFNGDSGSNYQAVEVTGDGASGSTNAYTTTDAHFQANGNTTTASTYTNTEVYIPNYSVAGVAKPFFADAVQENNTTSTLVQSRLIAWRWSGTAAISTINILTNGGNYVEGTTFSLYGIAALGTAPVIAPKATGGDIIVNDGTYWYHAFTTSGVFTPSSNITADAVVIGAGGAGGADVGGGAGAGRVYGLTALAMPSATNYVCTVGAGAPTQVPNSAGLKGTDSSLIGGVFSYTALAGGGGNGRVGGTAAVNDGWNGGGGSYDSVRTPTAGNGGFSGGTTSNPGTTNCQSGGGGGAAEAGNTDGIGQGGDGVDTYSSWATATATGVSGFYAGGGAGGFYSGFSVATGGAGGGGGGGNNTAPGLAGTAGTGSGGGGGGSSQNGGAGGSGIVIVRYTMA